MRVVLLPTGAKRCLAPRRNAAAVKILCSGSLVEALAVQTGRQTDRQALWFDCLRRTHKRSALCNDIASVYNEGANHLGSFETVAVRATLGERSRHA